MLERRSVNICWVQETRLEESQLERLVGKQKSIIYSCKEMKKGSWGVETFLVNKWVEKVIDISRESDRVIVIKILVQGVIISLISVYPPVV